ncbi:MAG: amidohydrolase family protein, partial [Acidobacteria bacterium]|nr:amidohydrolase family protein [Acidobacteriota bacterium]
IAARLSNCRLDTSGAWPGRGSALEQAVRKIGEDRILFGSDFLFHSPEVALAPIEQSALSERQKRKILSGNLEAMLAGLRKGA